MDLHAMLDLHVLENVQVTLDWDFFWRESTHNAIYRVSDTPIVWGAANDDRYVGSQGPIRIQSSARRTRMARDRRSQAGRRADDAGSPGNCALRARPRRALG